jgi:hypothetical protein
LFVLQAGFVFLSGCASVPENPTVLGHRAEFQDDYLVIREFGEMKPGFYGTTQAGKAREEAYMLAQQMCYDRFRTILESIVSEVGDSSWSGERTDLLEDVERKDERNGCWLTMRIPLNGSKSVSEILGFEGIVLR